ncbi:hypothetical protein Misp01_36210 [Microtetraspora sp. NBRC 13810]|nr:hypothetical protein Misp01_36210 [Microtetraspora sp. NBRC 13810]
MLPRDSCCQIYWQESRPRADRVRIKAYTCDCQPTFYELCQAGGLLYIRRTSRERRRVTVHETVWMVARDGEQLWTQLITGQVC